MSDRNLVYRILGDNRLGRSVNGAIGLLGKLNKTGLRVASSMASGMARIMKRGLQLGFAGSIAGAIWSVKDAMAVREMESKFDAVFKSLAAGARDWSQSFAKSVKRSEYDVRGWMSSIQDTLVPMGVARGEAAELSKEITALGVDLGSFNNMDAGDAVERIIGALVGNHENVRKFGVVITEAAMKQKALEMGLVKANQPLSEQAKLLTRLRMIQDGTTDAQGDAVRTAGSLMNRFKGLLSTFTTFRVELGNQIIDGTELGKVFDFMDRKLGGFIQRIKEGKIIEQWAEKAKSAFLSVGAVFKGLGDSETRGQAAKDMGRLIGAMFADAASFAVSIFLKAAPIIGKLIAEGAKGAMKSKILLADEEQRLTAYINNDQFTDDPSKQQKDRKQAREDLSQLGTWGYEMLEKEQKRLSLKANRTGNDSELRRFEIQMQKIGVDSGKLSRGGYRPGADIAEEYAGGNRTQKVMAELRETYKQNREELEKALEGADIEVTPKAAGNADASEKGKPDTTNKDGLADIGERKSLGLGEIFTRLQNGNLQIDKQEQMVAEQKETNRKLDKLVEKKEGGMIA